MVSSVPNNRLSQRFIDQMLLLAPKMKSIIDINEKSVNISCGPNGATQLQQDIFHAGVSINIILAINIIHIYDGRFC